MHIGDKSLTLQEYAPKFDLKNLQKLVQVFVQVSWLCVISISLLWLQKDQLMQHDKNSFSYLLDTNV